MHRDFMKSEFHRLAGTQPTVSCSNKCEKLGRISCQIEEAKESIIRGVIILVPEKRRFIEIIDDAIREVNKSFHVSTAVKIGGSVVGVAGGILAIVGYALLIPSFGAALPLAIAGTAMAVSGGLSSGGAAIGNAVTERRISKSLNDTVANGARILDELVSKLHEALKSTVEEIYRLDCPQLSADVRRRVALLKNEHLSMLLDAGENPSEDEKHIVELTKKLVTELEECDLQAGQTQKRMQKNEDTVEIYLSVPPTQSIDNDFVESLLTGSAIDATELIGSLDSLLGMFARLVKMKMLGTANAEDIGAIKVLANTRTLWRGGVGIAEGALRAAGRAGAQTAARIVGLVGSAVFTGVDVGLTAYYSWQLHKFKENGRLPELSQNLVCLRELLCSQIEELESLVDKRPC